jgi:prophage tail gpP-like protein
MPNPQEIAELNVSGVAYQDWESVYVQHRWQQGWPTFRFTATEKEVPQLYTDLKFKPGDPCTINLGGQLAVTGIITNRQVAYTATEHGIQLSGVGKQWAAVKSSVPLDKGMSNFDNMTPEEAIKKAVFQVQGSLKVIGTVDATKLERLQANPGELTWDFSDRVARMGLASMGSDHLGNVLLIGDHSYPTTQELIEGENILKMQCVFSNEQMSSEYAVNGQFAVTDEKTMAQAAEVRAKATGVMTGVYKYLGIPLEQPAKDQAQAQKRANYEALQADGTQVVANVTVQGWLRDGVNLWRCGDIVLINSPMCPLNLAMKIQTATFAQDSRAGTTTQLECVLPWKLGQRNYAGGNPKAGETTDFPKPDAATMPPLQPGTSAPVLPPELTPKGRR